MLYIQILAEVDGVPTKAQVINRDDMNLTNLYDYQNRNDWKSFQQVEAVAKALGEGFIATDAGSHVSPRYDVIKLPMIGEDVSYGFNGDYYPCGKIATISKTFKKIITTDGSVFYRKGLTGSWKKDQTWSLVSGVVNKRNSEF